MEFLTFRDVPDLDRDARAAGDALAIGAEGQAIDRVVVPLQRPEFLARLDVPELHASAVAGGDLLAICTEGRERPLDACTAEFPAGFGVPIGDDLAFHRGMVTSGEHPPA